MDNNALIIFAREPRLGQVKTRLQRELPADLVLRLYRAFLKDILKISLAVQCRGKYIYYRGSQASMSFFKQYNNRFSLKRQKGRDLGERMHQAFCNSQKLGYEKSIIIGVDCLLLSTRDIQRAFHRLEHHDMVLGPSTDGGYYLVGLKQPERSIFANIAWGTNSVLSTTLSKADRMQQKLFLLKTRSDIDTLDDLRHCFKLIKEGQCATHSYSLMKHLLKEQRSL